MLDRFLYSLISCSVWQREVCMPCPNTHSKEQSSCVLSHCGRTDVEAETPILWPPHVKSWLIGKDPDAGKDWGQEEKGTTQDEMAGWHQRFDRLRQLVMDRETWRAAVHGVTKSQTRLSDWTELNWQCPYYLPACARLDCALKQFLTWEHSVHTLPGLVAKQDHFRW